MIIDCGAMQKWSGHGLTKLTCSDTPELSINSHVDLPTYLTKYRILDEV